MKRCAILAPGYGGGADQKILLRLEAALAEHDITTRRIEFSTRGRRPSPDYASEIADLRAARDASKEWGAERIALVGRSFGGRICAFLAEQDPPDALAIVGHPISPPGRPRTRDEATLAALVCPTLIVQGDRDELGPLAVLERIAGLNPRVDLVPIAGAGHQLGPKEAEAVAIVARWLDSMLR